MGDDYENFEYPAEPLQGDQIRLVTILPGGKDEILQCELEVIQRDDNELYKALSYTWGDVTPTHWILVDKKKFWIHHNLWEALCRIRSEERTSRLGTDKICINQDDVPERNWQVQQMAKTYAGAEEVLIWLGSSCAKSSCLSDLIYLADHHAVLSHNEWAEFWPSVTYVFSKAWFSRVWTFR